VYVCGHKCALSYDNSNYNDHGTRIRTSTYEYHSISVMLVRLCSNKLLSVHIRTTGS